MILYNKKILGIVGISGFLIIVLIIFKGYLTEEKRELLNRTGQVFFSMESGFYEDAFELEMISELGDIYYTLDGTLPDKNSTKYETPLLITDATDNDNIYSMREDVSTGFDKEDIEKISSDFPPGYQTPKYKIDKATIVRAISYDDIGNSSDVKTAVYFVNFSDKIGYEGMKMLSIVTDPINLFDSETGIYVTGKTYDEYVKEYRGSDEYYWREEFWTLWKANYRNRGIEWEREAECFFFDESGQLLLKQECGIRIHGGSSRAYNPKSLNLYARKEYDGKEHFAYDFWGNGYYASEMTLFQGGNDTDTKVKDYLVSARCKNLNISTMNYEPYVLFLNGEYWGVYWLNEKFDADYFSYYYDINKDNVIVIKEGVLEEGEEEDFRYYSKMVDYCSKSDLTIAENYEKVCEMIDMNSYIDYYAVMLYVARNSDWPMGNYAMWRVKKTEAGSYGDGKWRWAVFDLNSAGFIVDFNSIEYVMDNDEMFKNMMTNDTFRKQLISKIEEIADTVFNYQDINKELEEYMDYMEEPMRKNNERFFGDNSLTDFYGEIEKIKFFFAGRKKYLYSILNNYR